MTTLVRLLVVLSVTALAESRLAFAGENATPDYYPLKAGAKWHYRLVVDGERQGRVIQQVSKIENVDGQPRAWVELVVRGDVKAVEQLSNTPAGLFRHAFSGVKVSPPMCLLRYPVKTGESWKIDTLFGEQKAKVTCRVGSESVRVPAGKYETVTARLKVQVGEMKISTTCWFAAGIGLVKQTAETAGITTTMELEEFEKGK